jgi:hypothetical protein
MMPRRCPAGRFFLGGGVPFLLKLRQETRQNQLDLSEIRFQWNENRPMNAGIRQ